MWTDIILQYTNWKLKLFDSKIFWYIKRYFSIIADFQIYYYLIFHIWLNSLWLILNEQFVAFKLLLFFTSVGTTMVVHRLHICEGFNGFFTHSHSSKSASDMSNVPWIHIYALSVLIYHHGSRICFIISK